MDRLIDVYRRYFSVEIAERDDRRDAAGRPGYAEFVQGTRLLKEAHRLRYQVYCVEHPFESPLDNPGGLEIDEFDHHSVHCVLIHEPSGRPAGTVRLVLPLPQEPSLCFPIHRVCEDPLLENPELFPVSIMAEVSRFSVSKDFRRRLGDTYCGVTDPDRAPAAPPQGEERRMIPHIKLGLIEGLVRMSIDRRVLYWCAEMEPWLLRMLGRIGIYFDPIGPLVDYHGLRQPCYVQLSRLLQRVYDEHPDIWEVITADGAHWEQLQALERELLPTPRFNPFRHAERMRA